MTLLAGAATARSFAAHAQQPTRPVIGFLSGRSPADSTRVLSAFRDGLAKTGFIDGANIAMAFRWANGQFDRLPTLAAELVAHPVVVLAAVGGSLSALAAKAATTTTPIVFAIGENPVSVGLVSNLDRPGGNITGATFSTVLLGPKRLRVLREIAPTAEAIGLLVNPATSEGLTQIKDVQEAAQSLGQRVIVLNASTDKELDAAFANLDAQGIGALIVGASPFSAPRRDRIIAQAARRRMPAIYQYRDFALAGGLISYGASVVELYRMAGISVGRILKGEKPGELPVMQPTKYELVINLKTAKTLGLTIPPAVRAIADEVIE